MNENDFVEQGIANVSALLESLRNRKSQQLLYMISVPRSVYERLLRDQYRGRPLFTGKKDGTNRQIQFDGAFFKSVEDKRLLIPLEMTIIASGKRVNLTNYSHEISRRMEAGEDLNMFEYDKDGKYIGCKVDGKLMPPEELKQLYPSPCQICGNITTKICSRCRFIFYCSVECQKADWPAHRPHCANSI